MTDAEVICTWMESRPVSHFEGDLMGYVGPPPFVSPHGWWHDISNKWVPRPLTLDALWKVEERLTDEQAAHYATRLVSVLPLLGRAAWVWHATTEHKIVALAAVLRPQVDC